MPHRILLIDKRARPCYCCSNFNWFKRESCANSKYNNMKYRSNDYITYLSSGNLLVCTHNRIRPII